MRTEPSPEHHWLTRLLGDWTWQAEPVPGTEFHDAKGTEQVRAFGDLWVQCVGEGGYGRSQMTLGFEPRTGRYVGTWIGDMATHLWVYDGVRDGETLTLAAVGPSFAMDGSMVPYHDVIEFLGPDERLLRASYQRADGGWTHFMTMRYRRV